MLAGERCMTSAVSSMERPAKKRSSTIRPWRSSSSGQAVQRIVQAEQIDIGADLRYGHGFVERQFDGARSALFGMLRARVVHQDAADHLGGDGVEVRAIAPLHVLLVHQAHEGFVDQRGALQGVVAALAAQVGAEASLRSSP